MIFAFMGEYKSGKDYLCDRLVQTQGAMRLSFSDEVRQLATELFPWLPFHISAEQKDVPYKHEQNPNNLTPRQIWLLCGKVRDVDPHFFVNKFIEHNDVILDRCFRSDNLFVITDFRTPQEWDFLRASDIPVVKVEREDRTGLIPSDFEEYVRRFTDYTAKFINRMNGTDDFDKFYDYFRKQYLEPQSTYRPF